MIRVIQTAFISGKEKNKNPFFHQQSISFMPVYFDEDYNYQINLEAENNYKEPTTDEESSEYSSVEIIDRFKAMLMNAY